MRAANVLLVLAMAGDSASAAAVIQPTLSAKVRAACTELAVEASTLTVPAALAKCNEVMGLKASGTLIAQADALIAQLGISFEESAAVAPAAAPASSPPAVPLRPGLVVFDLDFTLWRPELYELRGGPPFKESEHGGVVTSKGESLDLFPAARTALRRLASEGVPVAIASRASRVAWALEVMDLIRVDGKRTVTDVVGTSPIVIQPGSKTKHLKHISAETGVPLENMVFYDNEWSNINDVERMGGPTCVYCPRGMTEQVFKEGLEKHVGAIGCARSSAKASEREVEEAPGERKGKGRRGKATKRAAKESKRTKGRRARSRF
jgi:magnesium-dependent phosphatase 1